MAPRTSPDPRNTGRTGLGKDDRRTNTDSQADSERRESQPAAPRRGAGNTQGASDDATRGSATPDTTRDNASKSLNPNATSRPTRAEDTSETYLDDEAGLRGEDEEDQGTMTSADDEADTQDDERPS